LTDSRQPSTLRDYLQLVRRRVWVIVAVAVVGVAGALVFSVRQEKLYEASATVLVSGFDPSQSPDMFLQTQADIATSSPKIARAVREALGLATTPPITVTPASNSDILTFTSTAASPRLAARTATAYAQQYRAFQATLAKAHLNTARAFIVRAATQGVQVQPRLARNTVLGLLFGLILGFGLAFLRDALDTRVRSTDEIAEQLGLPLLARLPRPPAKLARHNRLLTVNDPDSLAAEGFKILRANVDIARMETEAQTLLVTSARDGEGKSTTVANLAVALARSGQRVVLVDLDLRHPFLHHFFQLEGPGVAQVATGTATLEEALTAIPLVWPGRPSANGQTANQHQPAGGLLEVLPAGPMPARLDDVLAKNILAGILETLRQRADIVLIDSTPLLTSDALATSAAVDAILLILRTDLARRPILTELRRILHSIPTPTLGFAAAGSEPRADYSDKVKKHRPLTRPREPVA
jgi:tyrosine-protein kinase